MDCTQQHIAQALNQSCRCLTLNPVTLRCDLDSVLPALTLPPHCFSSSPVFVSPRTLAKQKCLIEAIERVVALPAYQACVLAYAHENAQFRPPNASVFLGYDFHIDESGQPHLIEINTNAGGGLLCAFLSHAQQPCQHTSTATSQHDVAALLEMFEREWRCAHAQAPLLTIAIIDDDPPSQYLYAEFQLVAALFERRDIHAIICSPQALRYDGACLWHEERVVDMVYNRLTDFSLSQPEQKALAQAYLNGHVILTPTPHAYALYANKRNLTILSDDARLQSLGVDEVTRACLLEGIAPTRLVEATQAQALWQKRKSLFFKPTMGYGSKAAYRGDKLTKRVFDDILATEYVAQTFVAPSTRRLFIDGIDSIEQDFKFDVRAYVYAQTIQLTCARLYQGQTTNFRTEGGGFAPVMTPFIGE